MQQIDCPFCGARNQTEFTYVREAAAVPPLDAPPEVWQAYVYQRDNPAGVHAEWWHHHQGCRQMLKVERDTLTHAVYRVRSAHAVHAGADGHPGGSAPAAPDARVLPS